LFIAFVPLHILLCDEVLLYFILWVGAVWSSILFWIQINLQTIKDLENSKGFSFAIWTWAKTQMFLEVGPAQLLTQPGSALPRVACPNRGLTTMPNPVATPPPPRLTRLRPGLHRLVAALDFILHMWNQRSEFKRIQGRSLSPRDWTESNPNQIVFRFKSNSPTG
jgi:hypothetical protein